MAKVLCVLYDDPVDGALLRRCWTAVEPPLPSLGLPRAAERHTFTLRGGPDGSTAEDRQGASRLDPQPSATASRLRRVRGRPHVQPGGAFQLFGTQLEPRGRNRLAYLGQGLLESLPPVRGSGSQTVRFGIGAPWTTFFAAD
jgi:hypothetical protein